MSSRSKFSLLPHNVRWRAYNLLLDGATLQGLLSDRELADALDLAGITLNGANLTRIRQSKEYAEFAQMRREHLAGKERDLMLTAIAEDTGTTASMTDKVRVSLLAEIQQLTSLADMSEPERIQAVRSLTQSVSQLSNAQKDKQIAQLTRKLEDREAQIEALKKENQAREAELLAQISALSGSKKSGGVTKETLEKIEEKINMM